MAAFFSRRSHVKATQRPCSLMRLFFLFLLTLLLPRLSTAQISAANTIFTTTPVSPAAITNTTARTLLIQARDSSNNNLATGGSLFSAALFTTSPSCDTNITTPHCLISCSPSTSPFITSPACTSSTTLTTLPASAPNYVPINVSYSGSGQYQLVWYPQRPDNYTLFVSLLTPGGLTGTYYNNVWFLAPSAQQRVDSQINFNWGMGALTAYAVDYVSVRWRGVLMTSVTELFTLYTVADDWVRVWIDRRLVIEAWGSGICCNETWGSVNLTAGFTHDIIIDYVELTGSASITLSWRSPSTPKQLVPSTALYYRTAIQSAPYSPIVITPGLPSASTSYAYDNDTVTLGVGYTGGLSGSVAGLSTSVLLQAVDVFGNYNTNITTNLAAIQATMIGNDPSPTIVWNYISNGIYRLNYTVVLAGTYQLTIRIASIPLPTSPYTITVLPGPTSTAQSTIVGLPTACTSGVTCSFIVVAKDVLGNNRSSVASSDTVYVSWVNSGTSVGYQGLVSTTSNGVYYCYFTPTIVGNYQLSVFLNTFLMASTPTTVTVGYGALSPSASTAGFSGVLAVTAGVPATFNVTSRDAFGNLISTTSASYSYSITNSATGATQGSGTLTSTTPSGTYVATVTINLIGTYQLAITSSSISISGSPFTVSVVAGALSSSGSYVVAPVPGSAAAGNWVSGVASKLTIQARDGVGNAISVGGAAFASYLLCPSSSSVYATITDLGTGAYTAIVTPTTAGSSCSLYVYLGSASNPVTGSPFTVTVTAGAASGSSTASGPALTSGTAGVLSSITVAAFDAAGNALTTGNSPIIATIAPRSPLTSSATPTVIKTDFNNGQYTFAYTPTIAGTYTTTIASLVAGGLRATYYTDTAFTTVYGSRIDTQINFVWTGTTPMSGMPAIAYYSVQWVGKLLPPYTATYTFYIQSIADTGVQLSVGGSTLISALNSHGGSTYTYASMTLTAGTSYDFNLLYTTLQSGGSIQLMWSATSYFTQTLIPASAFQYIASIAGSPWTTTVVPAASSAAQSSYVTSPSSFIAAQAVTVTVSLSDRFGNAQITSSEAALLAATITVASYSYTSTFASTGTGGTYSAAITPYVAGSASLAVTYNSAAVGTTLVSTVAVGPLSALNCYVVGGGGGLTPVYAGVVQTFVVQTRDAGNNTLGYDVTSVAGGSIVLSVTITSVPSGTSIPSTVAYTGNGQYAVTYTPTTAATYSLSITFAAAAIRSSPFTVAVLAGAASGTTTKVVSGLYANATANSQSTLALINTYDAYGNLDASGGYSFVVRLYNKSAPTSTSSLVFATQHDYLNGTYAILYNTSNRGEYVGQILLAAGTSTASGGGGSGLTGTYYNNRWLSGTPALTRVDPVIYFDWGSASALTAITPTARDYVSISWTGYVLIVDATGTYTFTVTASDGARLYVNSLTVPLFDSFTGSGGGTGTVTFSTAGGPGAGGGVLYDVRLDYRHNVAAANVQLNWSCTTCSVAPFANSVVPMSNLWPSASPIIASSVDVFVL